MPVFHKHTRETKHWNTLDLFGTASLNVKTLPINGNKIVIAGARALAIATKMVVAGGDRTAGTVVLNANLYDSQGVALTTAAVDVLTAVDRFTIATKRGLIVLGERTVETVLDTGAGTITTKPEIYRSPIWMISFHVIAGAAYSGGTTDPTSATYTVELLARFDD